jgi:hypothetical protein
MALKTSNKNRKKEVIMETKVKEEKGPIHSWWWFSHNPKPYFVAAGILVFILLFA